ncbi:hypothetical protein RS9916_31092 [Synechococcus sp. RS9916]|nr:hypothetical protein RS9916_31092 [Synechococcus sp. RS9916]
METVPGVHSDHGAMPNEDWPLVDRHPQKNGEGWLLKEQEQLIVCYRNAMPLAHAKSIELETRPMRGSKAPVVRRMLLHNAIEVWTHIQKTGWKRCQPRW